MNKQYDPLDPDNTLQLEIPVKQVLQGASGKLRETWLVILGVMLLLSNLCLIVSWSTTPMPFGELMTDLVLLLAVNVSLYVPIRLIRMGKS